MATTITHWLCIVCGDPGKGYGQVEHDEGLDGREVGPPEGWVKRSIAYAWGTRGVGGVCSGCKGLSTEEANARMKYKYMRIVEDVT